MRLFNRRGASGIEYAFLLAMIGVVGIASVGSFSGVSVTPFDESDRAVREAVFASSIARPLAPSRVPRKAAPGRANGGYFRHLWWRRPEGAEITRSE